MIQEIEFQIELLTSLNTTKPDGHIKTRIMERLETLHSNLAYYKHLLRNETKSLSNQELQELNSLAKRL